MGRAMSPFGEAVRKLLDKHNGEITHLDARPILIEQGFDLIPEDKINHSTKKGRAAWGAEQNRFNTIKNQWKKANEAEGKTSKAKASKRNVSKDKGKVLESEFTISSALEYVKQNGGMERVKAEIEECQTKIASHKEAIKIVNEMQQQLDKVA